MTKIHPNGNGASSPRVKVPWKQSLGIKHVAEHHDHINEEHESESSMVVLTVWKKSLLFNCNGFTVYDSNGNLVFRVDNYMTGCGSKGGVVLMDAAGTPLLTVRRKRLSLGENWVVYDGESSVNPVFWGRKHVNILNGKSVAHVTHKNGAYEIEGPYAQRSCAVYDNKRRSVAEIKQKEAPIGGVAFGVDVFKLVVRTGQMDTSVAMAFVILLDQMFGSSARRH